MIYLDNAATSFPKPPEVLREAVRSVLTPLGNPGRSGHDLSRRSAEIVFRARENVARLLGLTKCENVVFTGGATAALNLAILGTVREVEKRVPKPLVVTSVFEHNSVLRPLYLLEKRGEIRLKILSPERSGAFYEAALLSPAPQIAVFTLRSNVTGRVFPLGEIARLLAPCGTLIIGDGAQAVGTLGGSFQESGVHILCAPGHKGLFGTMGAGFLALSDDCPLTPEVILSGGSGGETFSPFMPDLFPERLEAGTLPVPAIAALSAGAAFLLKEGVSRVTRRERALKRRLAEGIRSLPGFLLYEAEFPDGPLLINRIGMPSEKAASLLAEKGLCVRGGFHCAPLAHRFLKTEESGALRLSPGYFTADREIDEALNLLLSLKTSFL